MKNTMQSKPADYTPTPVPTFITLDSTRQKLLDALNRRIESNCSIDELQTLSYVLVQIRNSFC